MPQVAKIARVLFLLSFISASGFVLNNPSKAQVSNEVLLSVKADSVYFKGKPLPLIGASLGQNPNYLKFLKSAALVSISSSAGSKHKLAGFCVEPISSTQLIILGGYLPDKTSREYDSKQTWLWNTSNDTISPGPKMVNPRWFAGSCTLPKNRIFICGGFDGKKLVSTGEIIDWKTAITKTIRVSPPRERHTVVPSAQNQVLIIGGELDNGYARNIERVSLDGSIAKIGTLSIERRDAKVARLSATAIVVYGGSNSQNSSGLAPETVKLQTTIE